MGATMISIEDISGVDAMLPSDSSPCNINSISTKKSSGIAASILSLKADVKVDFVGHLLRSIMHLKYVLLADHRVLSQRFELLPLNRFGRAVALVTESFSVFLGSLVGIAILL